MIKWWKERHKRRLHARWRAGYDYAAGELLRYAHNHEENVEQLKRYVDSSRHWGVYDEFDTGVEEAISAFEELFGNGAD